MTCLSIRQPWAWLIVNGHKPIENRGWTTKVRGPILIHAGKSFDHEGYAWVRRRFPEIDMPNLFDLELGFDRGGLVGMADLWNVATAHTSPWFVGPYGFMLRHAKPLPSPNVFIPLAGKLGFFDVPDDVLKGAVL